MDRISPLLNKLGFWHLPAVCASLLLPLPKDLVDHPLNSTSISYSNRLEVDYACCPLTDTNQCIPDSLWERKWKILLTNEEED